MSDRGVALRLATPEEVVLRWDEIEPILRRATRHTRGCYEPVDVLRQAILGEVGFYLIEDDGLIGIAVTERRQYPRKAVLIINFVAGRQLAKWWPVFVEQMDAVARQCGCQEIGAYGRPGWVRFWKQRGVAQQIASEIMVRSL